MLGNDTRYYVRLNISSTGLSGVINDHGTAVYIEPLKNFIRSASADKYVIYKRGDSYPVKGVCGVSSSMETKIKNQLSSLTLPNVVCRKIEIATESDWENYDDGVTAGDIQANLNDVEPLYYDEFGASIVIKYQHEWATSNDPYNYTYACNDDTQHPNNRLQKFNLHWQKYFYDVKRDISILYSGIVLRIIAMPLCNGT